ncbi:MAG: hypothetical protein DLM55_06655 [Acidimicrobiales bacterium]|nr:MAG: hypothetical protein DLM55_06655 [Acidimicrobiales bacterium]
MSELVLSEGEIRAIWHEDPATMDRETLRQVAHYITRPPTSWDPDTFHRPVRQEPEEVLAAIAAMRARLQAYTADLEQEALRLNPTLEPGLTVDRRRELEHTLRREDKGGADFLSHGLSLRHVDLAMVVGYLAFQSAVVEAEGVGFYTDR